MDVRVKRQIRSNTGIQLDPLDIKISRATIYKYLFVRNIYNTAS